MYSIFTFTDYFAKKYERKVNECWSSERREGVSANNRGQHVTSASSKTPQRMRSLNEDRIVLPDKTVTELLIDFKVKRGPNILKSGSQVQV